MIVLRVKRSKENNDIKAFTVSGHAEYAKIAGELDIVCAAVSAIVYTALGYMEEHYGMEDFEESDGYINWVRPDKMSLEISHKINPVLDAMVVGIRQVEAQYRKHVKVVIEEV
jgi:uncharacterized protein YsxB (DUF464 family)